MPDLSPMDLALSLAEAAAADGEAPVGAVVVENGVVLAAERNRMQALRDPTAHAEILAIRTALVVRGTGRLDADDGAEPLVLQQWQQGAAPCTYVDRGPKMRQTVVEWAERLGVRPGGGYGLQV